MSTALLLPPTDPTVTPVRPVGPVAYTRKGAHMRVTKAPLVTVPRRIERRTAVVIWATAGLAGVLLGLVTDHPPAPPDRAPVVAGPTRLDLDLDQPGGEGQLDRTPETAPVADHDPTTTTVRPTRDRDPRPAAPAGPASTTTSAPAAEDPPPASSTTTTTTAPPAPSTTSTTATTTPPTSTTTSTTVPPTTAEPHLDPAPNPG